MSAADEKMINDAIELANQLASSSLSVCIQYTVCRCCT